MVIVKIPLVALVNTPRGAGVEAAVHPLGKLGVKAIERGSISAVRVGENVVMAGHGGAAHTDGHHGHGGDEGGHHGDGNGHGPGQGGDGAD